MHAVGLCCPYLAYLVCAAFFCPLQDEFLVEGDATGKPNLLLLVWDTVRAKSLTAFDEDALRVSPYLTESRESGDDV